VVVVQSGNEWELRAELGPGFRFGNSEYGLVVRRVLR
jgi:putative salt-induced outer membrane protein YdiY